MNSPDGARRLLLTGVVANYANDPRLDRPRLVTDQRMIVRLFTEEFGYELDPRLGLNPTREQLRAALGGFARDPERRSDDYVVIYLAGHGEVHEFGEGNTEHLFLPTDVDPQHPGFSSVKSSDLAEWLLDGTPIRRLMLIVDACHSGLGALDFSRSVLMRARWEAREETTGSGVVVLTATHPRQEAESGVFASAFDRAARHRASHGHGPPFVDVDAVMAVLKDDREVPPTQTANCTVLFAARPPDFLPNKRHAGALVELSVDEQDRQWAARREQAQLRAGELTGQFLPRIRGFVGRRRALADIAQWLRDPSDIRSHVVTGKPGSGKSALLGLLAALNDTERRPTVDLDGVGDPGIGSWVPPSGLIDVAIYASTLNAGEVLNGLAVGVGLDPIDPDPARLSQERLRVITELISRGRTVTILVDALDEAQDPDDLVESVVAPMLNLHNSPVRLLIGTRPHVTDRFPDQWRERHQPIDLDGPRYADPDSIAEVIRRTLTAPAILRPSMSWSTITSLPLDESATQSEAPNPYLTVAPKTLDGVVAALTEVAGSSFFVAKILAATQLAEPVPADPGDESWRATLPPKPGPAMRRDLETRLGPDAETAVELLRPLAYAQGGGLPWENIWPHLATALGTRTYSNLDLIRLRRLAGSYLVESANLDGRSVYRLYHRSLAEHLIENRDTDGDERAIAETLHQLVPRRAGGRLDWTRAHPYIRIHLATHASLLGMSTLRRDS